MKTCILTCFDQGFKPVSDLTLPILMEYCDRHGYSLRVEQNPGFSPVESGNPIVWYRLNMIRRAFQFYDLVVWMDGDVLITNLGERIEPKVLEYPKGIILSKDVNGINDGVMMVRSMSDSAEMIDRMLAFTGTTSPQDSLSRMLDSADFLSKSVVGFIPQRFINSYLYEEYNMVHSEGQWQPGDLCLHLPGLPISRRVELLKQYIPQIVR